MAQSAGSKLVIDGGLIHHRTIKRNRAQIDGTNRLRLAEKTIFQKDVELPALETVKHLQYYTLTCIVLGGIILIVSGWLGYNTLVNILTPSPSVSSFPILQSGAIQAGRQYYIILVGTLAVFVLLPWILLEGFSVQKATRMYYNLGNDLLYLNYDPKERRTIDKLNNRFNFWGYLWPLILITGFLNINIIWLFFPSAIYGLTQFTLNTSLGLNDYLFKVILSNVPTASVAVLVGYVYMLFQLVRRYNRDDITPNGYWEVIKHLIWAFVITFVATAFVASFNQNIALSFGLFFALISGIYEIESVQYLVRYAQVFIENKMAKTLDQTVQNTDHFSKLGSHLAVDNPLFLLNDMDKWDADRLMEEGVIGIQGMATIDIDRLVIWTPFPNRQIVDWVDQAILYITVGAELGVSYIDACRRIGLRTASCLVEAASDENVGITTIVNAMKTVIAGTNQKMPSELKQDLSNNGAEITEDVLKIILCSLEHNGNLKRICSFKMLDAEKIPYDRNGYAF